MTGYVKQTWVDNDVTKPLNAVRVQHIEDGLGALDAGSTPGRPAAYEWQWDTPPDAETTGAWNPTSSTAQFHRYGWAWPTGGDVNSDRQWRWNVPVYPGTTKLYLAYAKRQDFGITTWELSLDGGSTWSSLGTLDLYVNNASVDQNTAYRAYLGAGLSITAPQMAILRVRNPTRNASATGWYWGLSFLRFWTV